MYSSVSFQAAQEFGVTTSNCQFMGSHLADSTSLDICSLLNTDTLSVSTDSLSPCSHSSLSGDEELSIGKRRRSYNSLPQSPKRLKYNIFDEVFPAHSPESGIALSPPMAVYTQNPICGKVWISILEQPEEYYRARYASEGSRGPLKGRSHNSCPKVQLMMEEGSEHVSAMITVSLVHDDNTVHSVCSLATAEEDGPSNVSKRATGPEFIVEFDQLRVKRERHTGGAKGKQKAKAHKQNESTGYLLFRADITTMNGQLTCQTRSDEIKLTTKPESAELHAIKNDYASVEGDDEVWIRGSKMIGNRELPYQLSLQLVTMTLPTASVYFEVFDHSTKKCIGRYAGNVMKEESHQNLLVVKTPKVPFNDKVLSHVVVITGKDKMKSNPLPFTFIPTGAPLIPPGVFYQKPSKSPMSLCYSPQPPTPPSATVFTADDLPFVPCSPPANEFEGMLDICAQQLDKHAEEKILPTAALPADSSSLTVQGLDENVVLPPNSPSSLDMQELAKNESSIIPPTILLPAVSAVHQPAIFVDVNINN